MDTWVASTFRLLQMMLSWTLTYSISSSSYFQFFEGIYLGVELVGCMVSPCLTFWVRVCKHAQSLSHVQLFVTS